MTVDGLVDAVRTRTRAERSDRAVRALAALGRQDPEATALLVHALAPLLWTSLRKDTTDTYRSY